ncbi:hypothetical protein [Roseiterribacter gracilis]|uniref:Uncharacterized protein n=1 Tax=Roseiterribacter gracilis TaxID=2812848 RepID=A0A8S8XKK8_9PROT|nr:hypothetical protein TMPK1_35670 [Rhodospirillales bacterium TMPK1]
MKREERETFPAAWLLLPLAALWVVLLLAHPGLPRGVAPGWTVWFDQSHYLDQALQIARGAIDPKGFFYPPLYPALGALAIKLGVSPTFAFQPVDLLCFLVFALAFVRTAERFVAPVVAVTLFVATVCARPIVEHWVVPWTTTPAATLVALLIYASCAAARVRPIVIGLLLGLLATTRPLDAMPAAFLVLVRLPSLLRDAEAPRLDTLAKLAFGTLVPVLALVAFDLAVWGNALGDYYRLADGSRPGLSPATAIGKFVALWTDGSSFGLPHETMLAHEPWLFLGLAGCALALVAGSNALAAIAVALVLHVLAYAAFNDLTPANLFRYGLVHYLKWTYPYFALLAVATPFAAARNGRAAPALAALLAAIVVGCAGWHMRNVPVAVAHDEAALRITLAGDKADAIDLDGATLHSPSWDLVGVTKDGASLLRGREIHATAWQDHTRFIFTRPIQPGELVVPLDQLDLRGEPAARAQRQHLGLRWPVWLQVD